jgi:hypothetical protein
LLVSNGTDPSLPLQSQTSPASAAEHADSFATLLTTPLPPPPQRHHRRRSRPPGSAWRHRRTFGWAIASCARTSCSTGRATGGCGAVSLSAADAGNSPTSSPTPATPRPPGNAAPCWTPSLTDPTADGCFCFHLTPRRPNRVRPWPSVSTRTLALAGGPTRNRPCRDRDRCGNMVRWGKRQINPRRTFDQSATAAGGRDAAGKRQATKDQAPKDV